MLRKSVAVLAFVLLCVGVAYAAGEGGDQDKAAREQKWKGQQIQRLEQSAARSDEELARLEKQIANLSTDQEKKAASDLLELSRKRVTLEKAQLEALKANNMEDFHKASSQMGAIHAQLRTLNDVVRLYLQNAEIRNHMERYGDNAELKALAGRVIDANVKLAEARMSMADTEKQAAELQNELRAKERDVMKAAPKEKKPHDRPAKKAKGGDAGAPPAPTEEK